MSTLKVGSRRSAVEAPLVKLRKRRLYLFAFCLTCLIQVCAILRNPTSLAAVRKAVGWSITQFLDTKPERQPDAAPIVLNLIPFLNSKCCNERASDPQLPREQLPVKEWDELFGQYMESANRLHIWRSTPENGGILEPHRRICKNFLQQTVCDVAYDPNLFDRADAVMLPHIALSRIPLLLENASVQRKILFPEQRIRRNQIWGLEIMGESTKYYPAGASADVLNYFNLSWGWGPLAANLKLSYLPRWQRLQHVDMAEKSSLAAKINATSSVVMIVSNCFSQSNREQFFWDFMSYMKVDSFGACMNNKDFGELKFDANQSNYHLVFSDRVQEILRAYKFQLVLENSVDNHYVTEKIFHAWEAGLVPLYLGAPEIDLYVPGDNSYIDLREMTAQQAATLVQNLSTNDEAYLEYHKWRQNISVAREPFGPLGKIVSQSNNFDPLCEVCKALHGT